MPAVDVLVLEFLSRNSGRFIGDLNSVTGAIGRTESAGDALMRRPMTFAAVGAAGLIATSKLVAASLEKAGEAQTTKTGLATLLGDKKKADDLFKKSEKFALDSPFDDAQTKKLISFLLATGTTADQVIPRLHAMGNAVSAAGKGQAELTGVSMAMSALGNSTVASRAQIKRLEIRGIQASKILQEELGLTADQVANLGKENLKGSVVAEALYRGMEKIGGGKAMENMVKTLPGQIATLEDAKNQLLTAVGEPMLEDATKFVGMIGRGAQFMKDMARAHPQLTKGVVYGVGAASAGAALYGTYKAAKLATLAKTALEKATRADDVAEKAKSATALKESVALTKSATAATKATTAKEALANATRTLTARTSAFLAKDALVIKDTSLLGRMGAQAGARSVGQVGLGAAAGAIAGYGVYDTYSNETNQAALRSMGITVSDSGAKMGGAAVAGIVGALTIAAPQFAIPIIAAVAAAKGTEYAANKLINEPQEKKAAAGDGVDNAEMYGKGMDARLAKADREKNYGEMYKIYQHMSDKAGNSGDRDLAKRYQFQSDLYKKKYQQELITGPDTFSQAYRDKIAAERSTPEYQANVRKQFERADEQGARINASVGLGPEGLRREDVLAFQQRQAQGGQAFTGGAPMAGQQQQGQGAGLTPYGQATNSQRVDSNGRRVVTVTQNFVIEEDPRLRAAQRAQDNAVRRAYGG